MIWFLTKVKLLIIYPKVISVQAKRGIQLVK